LHSDGKGQQAYEEYVAILVFQAMMMPTLMLPQPLAAHLIIVDLTSLKIYVIRLKMT
jgi:hypothetical protein